MQHRDAYRTGPRVVAAAAGVAAVGLVVAQVLGFSDPLVPLLWAALVVAVVFAATASVLAGPKRRAAELARLIGVPTFAARMSVAGSAQDASAGLSPGFLREAEALASPYRAADQLPSADGYAAPLHPILCARDGLLEFWRGADQSGPYAVVPLGLVRARVDPDRMMLQASALLLEIEGLPLPLALSFYRQGWAAVLPADALDLAAIAAELGLRMADPDAEPGAAAA